MRKNWIQILITTILVLALGLWVISKSNVRLDQVWATIKALGWQYALLAFVGCFGQVLFLILRHQALIPQEYRPGFRKVLYAAGMGHMLNTYLPARAGDVMKAVILSRGTPPSMSFLTATGALVADRLVDITVLVFMGLLWRSNNHLKLQNWIENTPWSLGLALGLVALSLVAGAVYWFRRHGSDRMAKWSSEFRDGTLCLIRPAALSWGILLAFLSWSGEVLAILSLSQSQGLSLSFGNALFVVIALNAAISVPFSLANVGPFEAAVALSLTSFGMDPAQAIAVGTVHHAIQLVAITLWGGFATAWRKG